MEELLNFTPLSVCARLLLACLLGDLIGIERGRHGRAAGLRTHILVSIGACMTSLMSEYIQQQTAFTGDVFRISAQVISGIGFLGAGTILVKNQSVVMGLTTAAGVWCTAAIGVATGYGFYLGAIVCTAICFLTTGLLTLFEIKNKRTFYLYAEIGAPSYVSSAIRSVKQILPEDARFDIIPAKSAIPGAIGLHIVIGKTLDERWLDSIGALDGILFVAEEHV